MKHKQIISTLLAVVMLLSVAPVSFAANNSKETATPIQVGETVTLTAEPRTNYYYSVQTTAPGQFLVVEGDIGYLNYYNGNNSLNSSSDNGVEICKTNEAGTQYIRAYHNDSVARPISFTLKAIWNNDANESNDAFGTATPLTSGVPMDFIMGIDDTDWFAIETTKDGQDVKIDFSGFNYANTGYFDFQPDGGAYIRIEGNKTLYVHVPKAGRFAFYLDSYYSNSDDWATTGSFRVTATVLDGDANEPNGHPSAYRYRCHLLHGR